MMHFFNIPFITKIRSSKVKVTDILKPISRVLSTEPGSCQSKKVILEPCCNVAVITGGAEGIGLATAHHLLCQKANHVALIGNDISKGLEAVNTLNCGHGKNKATFLLCDISKRDAVEDTLSKIKHEFKDVKMFIHCAGIWDEKNWEKNLSVNLNGTLNFNMGVRKVFIKNPGSVIINLTAIPGLEPFHCSPVHAATHAAIIRFSQSLGHEITYKSNGMRVIALCVGITCTDYIKDLDQRLPCEWSKECVNVYLRKSHLQKADVVARSIIEVIKFAHSGTVWLIEDSRLFEVCFPDWRITTHLISQYS